jgi:hypothetical protein
MSCCPSCAAPCCVSSSSTCRRPPVARRCGSGTPGSPPLSIDELWRACLARFDEEHGFRFLRGALGLAAAKVRTPEQAGRWVRLVTAACAQLLLARPHIADLRRPWEKPTVPDRPLTPGRGPPRVSRHPPPDRHPGTCRQTRTSRTRTTQRLRQRPGTPLPDPQEKPQQGHNGQPAKNRRLKPKFRTSGAMAGLKALVQAIRSMACCNYGASSRAEKKTG